MAGPGPRSDTAREIPPGMPRWVKVAGIVVGVLIVAFLALKLTGIGGEHGPGRHMSGPGASPAGVAVDVSAAVGVG